MNKRVNRNGITVLAKQFNDYRGSLLTQEPHGDYGQESFKLSVQLQVFDAMVIHVADMLEGNNENFDRDRFFNVVYNDREE